MERLTYLGVLLFIFVGSAWLEIALRTRVLRRWKRLLLALAVPFTLFVIWDIWAIVTGHWSIDPDRTVVRAGGHALPPAATGTVPPPASISRSRRRVRPRCRRASRRPVT